MTTSFITVPTDQYYAMVILIVLWAICTIVLGLRAYQLERYVKWVHRHQ